MDDSQLPQSLTRRVAHIAIGRVLPGAVFLVFSATQLQILLPEVLAASRVQPGYDVLALILNRGMSILFASMIALIYVVRLRSRHGNHSPVAIAVSMYASFVLLATRPVGVYLGGLNAAHVDDLVITVSNVLLVAGIGFSVYALLYLRLNFSIVPEARELVSILSVILIVVSLAGFIGIKVPGAG